MYLKNEIFKYQYGILFTVITVLLIAFPNMSYSQLNINQLSDAEKGRILGFDSITISSAIISWDSIETNKIQNEITDIVDESQNKIEEEVSDVKSKFSNDSILLREKLSDQINQVRKFGSSSKKIFSEFSLIAGMNASYYPISDTTVVNPGIYKSYWVSISETVYGLPFQIGVATGDGISYSEDVIKPPVQFNLNFDYDQFLTNAKEQMIENFEAKKDDIFKEFEQINFEDSVQIYNSLKDTLSNSTYLEYIGQLRDRKSAILDSINNCYEVDSSRLAEIDTILEKYNQYRTAFNRMISFQNKYYELKSKYDTYLDKLESVKQTVESNSDLPGLLNTANEYGLSADFPQWPLHFKKFQVGAQFVNYTPLTFQNYVSNGVSIDYVDDQLILKANALTQNWFSGNLLTSDNDSLINIFQNNQSAYITGIGFGNPDSNHILFTTAFIKENTSTQISSNVYSNFLLSFYQKTRLVNNFYLEYELAKSQNILKTEAIDVDTIKNNNFLMQGAVYSKLSYGIPQIKINISLDQSLIGLAYISLANPFIHSGTSNSGIGIEQSLLESKLKLSYKITYFNTLASNTQNYNTVYHIGQADYQIGKWGSIHFMLSPYQYQYSIQDVTGSENTGESNFINCYAVLNFPMKKSTITTLINYSNFTTQSSFTDTIFFFKTKTFSINNIAAINGRNYSSNVLYFIPEENSSDFFVNSADLKATIIDKKFLYLDLGPKWLGYKSYNDQLGVSISLNSKLGKFLNWFLSLDKYFEIEHTQQNFYSNVFFNTGLSITLN